MVARAPDVAEPAAAAGEERRLEIRAGQDVVRVRQAARQLTVAAAFSLVDQTKLVTAASELARNTLIHGGGGEAVLRLVEEGARRGVHLCFHDDGPGIPDLELALTDGFSTGSGLGLGLSGARRLVDEFDIESRGSGTVVQITKWAR